MSEPDITKSSFNSAWKFMEELSDLRIALHKTRIDKDIEKRYDVLVAYYTALSSRMKPNMQDKHDAAYKKVREGFREIMKARSGKTRSVPTKYFDYFDEWEIQLRKDENKLGLLVRDDDDPANAISAGMY